MACVSRIFGSLNFSVAMKILAFVAVLMPLALRAQTGSEIYLFDLSLRKNSARLANPRNITQHPGYDNQPFFHPTQPVLLYASFNEEGRAEIKSYNLTTQQTALVTQTAEREYSPTVTPDLQHFSCIVQRDNGAQDLGKYALAGGPAEVLINHLTVGYHAWLDNSHVALFVLGEPNTLHVLRLPDREDTVIARNIGRSLHKIPREPAISFVQKANEGWQIMKWNHREQKLTPVAPCLPNREDLTWTPRGEIIMSDGAGFFIWRGGKSAQWLPVALPTDWKSKGVTRLAASADGKKLAVVVAE
jgi:hypothetical protein